jgi:hypothetical protein
MARLRYAPRSKATHPVALVPPPIIPLRGLCLRSRPTPTTAGQTPLGWRGAREDQGSTTYSVHRVTA